MMTHKQRMLDVVAGKPVDRIPWVPRLDLWHRANRLAGTLPAKYRSASLMEMTDDLGWASHAVVPDYQDLRGPEDQADWPLGIHNLRVMPVRTVWEGVDRRMTQRGDRTTVEYRTPLGTVATEMVYDDAMRRAGVTIPHVSRYAFQGPDDYGPLGYLFRHARAEPDYAGYVEWAASVGERGFVVAYVSAAASPMHLIQRSLMPVDTFFYELHDRPDEVRRLADQVAGYWRQVLEVAAGCPAEVLLLGANYDSAIQHPRFFAEHIGPWLAEFAAMLHPRGKYLLTHTDGENRGLLEHYVASGFDIADSVCPRPMTRLSLAEVREAFGGRIAIMGGIPSVALLEESLSDARFEAFCDEFFAELGRGDRLILGVSDTTPPGAKFERLLALARRVEKWGAPEEA